MNVFPNISNKEFISVYSNYRRLSFQYKLLRICEFLEKLYIPVINFPILKFISMLLDFFRYKLYDFLMSFCISKVFNLYGVTCFCGRQGGGKTIGVVELCDRIKSRFPDCVLCTNINYVGQDVPLVSWLQLLTLRNGEKGVVFVIDEVQNQGLDWNTFPDSLLRVITMQRKQKIKIYLTSQVYKNVVIQLRRQCFDVVECRTFFGRWSRQKCYDADEYNSILDVATTFKRSRMRKLWKYSYIQSNSLRRRYDTNQVVGVLRDFDKLCKEEYRVVNTSFSGYTMPGGIIEKL